MPARLLVKFLLELFLSLFMMNSNFSMPRRCSSVPDSCLSACLGGCWYMASFSSEAIRTLLPECYILIQIQLLSGHSRPSCLPILTSCLVSVAAAQSAILSCSLSAPVPLSCIAFSESLHVTMSLASSSCRRISKLYLTNRT